MVLKRQQFQDKHHMKSFANFAFRKVKIMTYKELSKTAEDMLDKAIALMLLN